jgi:hypothetical protein
MALVAALVAGFWVSGLVAFASTRGVLSVTLPRRRPDPPERHNLASWDLGPTIRASSYHDDLGTQHHPAFLVDGRAFPDPIEKWASSERDRHPWVEISWREPHDVDRVLVRHAGDREFTEYTARNYRIRCLLERGVGPSVDVKDNRESVASHAIECQRARGVRLDIEPNGPTEIVRVYEVEAWGL